MASVVCAVKSGVWDKAQFDLFHVENYVAFSPSLKALNVEHFKALLVGGGCHRHPESLIKFPETSELGGEGPLYSFQEVDAGRVGRGPDHTRIFHLHANQVLQQREHKVC